MNRFLIGQYGSFQYSRYHRDFKEGFYGIEACLFSRDEDIENLIFRDKVENYKYPVLPEQNPKDGWTPIRAYLQRIHV